MLEGTHEFTLERDGGLQTISASAGTSIAVPPSVAPTLKNGSGAPARLLLVHQPAALEQFFEQFGVPVARNGQELKGVDPPDFAAMEAALERNGVQIVREPSVMRRRTNRGLHAH